MSVHPMAQRGSFEFPLKRLGYLENGRMEFESGDGFGSKASQNNYGFHLVFIYPRDKIADLEKKAGILQSVFGAWFSVSCR